MKLKRKSIHPYLFILSSVFLISSCSHLLKNNISSTEQAEIDGESLDNIPKELGSFTTRENLNLEEIKAYEESKKGFPLVHNEYVQKWINYFTSPRGRKTYRKWLSRKTRYAPLIKKTLIEEGLPQDLIFLAMIESGFNPRAYSHAAAMGPWQFIKSTGKRYGLNVTYWVDERSDIEKATRAAATYLKELYQVFGSWYLAAAAYNGGEGRVLNAIRRDRTRNFWALIQNKRNFRPETRNYVPKIIAAAYLGKNPDKYGFTNIPYESELEWKTVEVPQGVDIRAVAKVTKTPLRKIKLLNAELRIGITPPNNKKTYPLKVPPSKVELLSKNIKSLKTMQLKYFVNHKVRKGENLGFIARRYRTRVSTLMRLNNIRNARYLRIGQRLKVPIPGGKGSRRVARSQKRRRSAVRDGKHAVHTIRKGETLSEISELYRVSVRSIMSLNNIRSARRIRYGMKIAIPNSLSKTKNRQTFRKNASIKGMKTHVVRRGENLGMIARRYQTRIAALKKANNIRNVRHLQIGQSLLIPQ